ncbi:MAG: hypothetical protein CM15mP18_2620 [Methanobacteriota archaeon]|nr:MAG: hypothetical protein CM15mP18_2620 [Euryarchaeota archaeon]
MESTIAFRRRGRHRSIPRSGQGESRRPSFVVVGPVPREHRSTTAGFLQQFTVHRLLRALTRLDPTTGEFHPGQDDGRARVGLLAKGGATGRLPRRPTPARTASESIPMPVRARSRRSAAHGSPLAKARRARKKASACSPLSRRDWILTSCGSRASTTSSGSTTTEPPPAARCGCAGSIIAERKRCRVSTSGGDHGCWDAPSRPAFRRAWNRSRTSMCGRKVWT